MPGDGICTLCGADIHMSNCPPTWPDVEYCEQCGQCSCLARTENINAD